MYSRRKAKTKTKTKWRPRPFESETSINFRYKSSWSYMKPHQAQIRSRKILSLAVALDPKILSCMEPHMWVGCWAESWVEILGWGYDFPSYQRVDRPAWGCRVMFNTAVPVRYSNKVKYLEIHDQDLGHRFSLKKRIFGPSIKIGTLPNKPIKNLNKIGTGTVSKKSLERTTFKRCKLCIKLIEIERFWKKFYQAGKPKDCFSSDKRG